MPTPSTDLTFQPLLLESCPQITRVLEISRPVFDSIPGLHGLEMDFLYREGLFDAVPEQARLFCSSAPGLESTETHTQDQIAPRDRAEVTRLLEILSNEPAICDRIGEFNQTRPVGADPHDFVVAVFRHCIVLRHADPIALIQKMHKDFTDYPFDPYVRGRLLTFALPVVASHHEVLKHACGILDDIERYRIARPDIRNALNSDFRIRLKMPTAADFSAVMLASRKTRTT